MTPARASIVHDPSTGSYGDCYRTAVACLLDRPPDDVPHVTHDGCGAEVAVHRMREWLRREHAFDLVNVPFAASIGSETVPVDAVLEMMSATNPRAYWILIGATDSHASTGHAVVCCGGTVVCDPSTGRPDNPITGPERLTGAYWLVLFVPVAMTGGERVS